MAEKRGERGQFRLLSEIKWEVEISQSGSDTMAVASVSRFSSTQNNDHDSIIKNNNNQIRTSTKLKGLTINMIES